MATPSPQITAFLTLAAFATSAVSGAVGMVGSTTLMGIVGLVLPFNVAVPVHGASSLASNMSRCWLGWSRVPKRLFAFFALGVPAGAVGAYLVLSRIQHRIWFLVLLELLVLYTLSKPGDLAGIRIPDWAFAVLGAVAAWLACLVGSVGPLLVPFVARDDLDPEQFVFLKASFQMLLHLVKLPVFYLLAFPFRRYLPLILLMALGSVIGSRVGVGLLRRLDRPSFVRFVRVVLVVLAITIGYRIAMEL